MTRRDAVWLTIGALAGPVLGVTYTWLRYHSLINPT